MVDFALEQESRASGYRVIAGVDEAGRGPWAGPVVAAAVILDPEMSPASLLSLLDDSKALDRRRRAAAFEALSEHAAIGVGRIEVEVIDRVNILQATLRAMSQAIAALPATPDVALVDGNRAPRLDCPVRCCVRGDARSLSIAGASIVAKVTRDRIMGDLDRAHPGYGWARNAGYGTREHRQALERLGVTAHHRRSFAPIRKMLRLDSP